MTSEDYRAALNAATAEYEKLGEERRRIDARLSQLAQTISTLSRLLGLNPTVPLGLTDALRLVYRNAGIPLSPVEARDRLEAIGIDLSIYSSPMAAIHTVLRRLHDGGELKAMATAGKQIYAWVTPARSVAIGPDVAQYIREQGTFHVTPPPKPRSRRKR